MLKICKFSVAMLFINLYVIYTFWGRYIPYGTLIFGFTATVTMVLHALLPKNYQLFTKAKVELLTLLGFIIWAYITAPFAISTETALSGCFDVLQKILMVIVIYYICSFDGSLKFVTKLFLGIAFAAAFYTILNNGNMEKRVALSSNVSENVLGNIMVFGVFCAIYLFQGKHWWSLSLITGISALFSFVVALSGSRKSIFAIVLLLFCCLLFVPKNNKISGKSFLSMFLLVIVLIVLIIYVYPLVSNTSLYARFFDEKYATRANASNEGRIELYITAWREFTQSFLWGIGIKIFNYENGSYTHSAYAEVMVSTGLVGIILYFTSYIRIFFTFVRGLFDKTITDSKKRDSRLCLCFFITFLYVGVGVGHLYDNVSMVELGMFIAASKLFYVDLREKFVERKVTNEQKEIKSPANSI